MRENRRNKDTGGEKKTERDRESKTREGENKKERGSERQRGRDIERERMLRAFNEEQKSAGSIVHRFDLASLFLSKTSHLHLSVRVIKGLELMSVSVTIPGGEGEDRE